VARRQFQQGWFNEAIAGWDKLWDELKDQRDAGAVEIANESLCHLLEAFIGLGKADRLTTLLGEQETRPAIRWYKLKSCARRQSVWLLKHKPSQSVMCGPVALYCILQNRQQLFTPIRLNDVTDDFIATGLSLGQLQKYADSYGMNLIAARRLLRLPFPLPQSCICRQDIFRQFSTKATDTTCWKIGRCSSKAGSGLTPWRRNRVAIFWCRPNLCHRAGKPCPNRKLVGSLAGTALTDSNR
jgi:hypothetical protein